MYLPLSLSDILAANLAGASVTLLGYYNPFLLSGTALMSIGIGLLTTFAISTGHQHWISYEVICGLGAGMTVTMPVTAAQTVLTREQVPVGTAIIMPFQFFGGSVFLAISQCLFSNKLVESVSMQVHRPCVRLSQLHSCLVCLKRTTLASLRRSMLQLRRPLAHLLQLWVWSGEV